jgi:hypothetical protein
MTRPSLSTSLFLGGLLAVGAAVLHSRGSEAAMAPGVATVAYLSGTGERAVGDNDFKQVAQGASLAEGDRIRTGQSSRMELKLKDGSLVRLGEKSEIKLRAASFGPKVNQRRFDAKLFAGRLWAAVTKMVGGDATFEVETANAVAGVRGTRFGATVDATGETTVRVYDGSVLVSNRPVYAQAGATKAKRVQVAGPQEISKKQWTEMVAAAMQLVRVSAAGEISQPQSFAMTDAATDDWEAWNSARDTQAGMAGQ